MKRDIQFDFGGNESKHAHFVRGRWEGIRGKINYEEGDVGMIYGGDESKHAHFVRWGRVGTRGRTVERVEGGR
jgi:hypothetical protein